MAFGIIGPHEKMRPQRGRRGVRRFKLYRLRGRQSWR